MLGVRFRAGFGFGFMDYELGSQVRGRDKVEGSLSGSTCVSTSRLTRSHKLRTD